MYMRKAIIKMERHNTRNQYLIFPFFFFCFGSPSPNKHAQIAVARIFDLLPYQCANVYVQNIKDLVTLQKVTHAHNAIYEAYFFAQY